MKNNPVTLLRYRTQTREYFRAYNNQKRKRRKLALIAYMGGKCVDCGFADTNRPEVFQADHLPKFEKVIEVAKILMGPWEAVEAEANKCELVCANCHATRTASRN